MKRMVLFTLLLLLLFGCTKPQKNTVSEVTQGQAVSIDDEKGYILKSFDYYHNNGSVFNTFEFLQNPVDTKDKCFFAGEKFGFRFIDKDGHLRLENMCHFGKNQYYDMYGFFASERGFYPNEQCSDAIAFLCDQEAIKECFSKNGVKDIREITILRFSDHKTGYLAVALTENEAYYMTVPVAEAEYGDYIYQKVHTSEAFKKLYAPRAADVYIDGKKMESPSATLFGEKYLEMDILSFLETLGYECKYDLKKQEITAGEYIIKLEYKCSACLYLTALNLVCIAFVIGKACENFGKSWGCRKYCS